MDGNKQAVDHTVAIEIAARLAALSIAAPPDRTAAVGAQMEILELHVAIVRQALTEIGRDERA